MTQLRDGLRQGRCAGRKAWSWSATRSRSDVECRAFSRPNRCGFVCVADGTGWAGGGAGNSAATWVAEVVVQRTWRVFDRACDREWQLSPDCSKYRHGVRRSPDGERQTRDSCVCLWRWARRPASSRSRVDQGSDLRRCAGSSGGGVVMQGLGLRQKARPDTEWRTPIGVTPIGDCCFPA